MSGPATTGSDRDVEPRLIPYDSVDHAAWTAGMDGGEELMGIAAVRYARFKRRVNVTGIGVRPWTLRFGSEGKRVMVPAHVVIQTLDEADAQWRTIADVELPAAPEPRTALVTVEATATDHLRVVCDRKHPLPPIHANWWVRPAVVPFSILDGLEVWGAYEGPQREPPYHPPLTVERVDASALPGQEVVCDAHQVTYRSPYLSLGFSLRRPMIVHLGWDALGAGAADDNLVPHGSIRLTSDSYCGPMLRALDVDAEASVWSGSVDVIGNKVRYRGLRAVDDFELDVEFEVGVRDMQVVIRKACHRDLHAVEADDWRFVWSAKDCITGTLGVPLRGRGRTGVVPLPAMWNAPGHGCIGIRETEPAGRDVVLQVDSWRDKAIGWSGISLGWQRDPFGGLFMAKGVYETSLTLAVTSLGPKPRSGQTAPGVEATRSGATSPGIVRNWSSAFGFRPELGGFSNNSLSCNCHMSQYLVADMVVHTAAPDPYPPMSELMRYTVELAIKDGPGYGEGFIDNDPSILIALARVQQAQPDPGWVRDMLPHVARLLERTFAGIDDSGLFRCATLSGNSGSKRWGSNAWDVVGFGHYDAYGNALVYRSLRAIAPLLDDAGESALAERCRTGADRLKAGYRACFFNPDTGWLAGWRSADGELHDYGFTHINFMAVCYGLLEPDEARAVVARMEDRMRDMNLTYFKYGIPVNLFSISSHDAPTGNDYARADGLDSYGVYVNGCLTTCWAGYYLGALSLCGYEEKADRVRGELERYFGTRDAAGALWSGTEFRTWEGRPCGYEGVCVGSYPVLTAMAARSGLVDDAGWWEETTDSGAEERGGPRAMPLSSTS